MEHSEAQPHDTITCHCAKDLEFAITKLDERRAVDASVSISIALAFGSADFAELTACLMLLNARGSSGIRELQVTGRSGSGCPLTASDLLLIASALCDARLDRPQSYLTVGPQSDEVDDAEPDFNLFAAAGDSVPAFAAGTMAAADTHTSGATSSDDCQCKVVRLQALALTSCSSSASEAWSPFWRALPLHLTSLDLTGNGLNDRAVSALCGALPLNSPLEDLKLAGNRCKDIDRLCGLLAAGRLRSLDLAENTLNDKSAAQLSTALSSSSAALRHLSLAGNRRLSAAGLHSLIAQLPRSPLRSLVLDRTCLGSDGGAQLAEVLASCTYLETLSVVEAGLSSSCSRELLEAAQATPGVRRMTTVEGGQSLLWRRCTSPSELLGFAGLSAADMRMAVAT